MRSRAKAWNAGFVSLVLMGGTALAMVGEVAVAVIRRLLLSECHLDDRITSLFRQARSVLECGP
jgi:hypothetical protein